MFALHFTFIGNCKDWSQSRFPDHLCHLCSEAWNLCSVLHFSWSFSFTSDRGYYHQYSLPGREKVSAKGSENQGREKEIGYGKRHCSEICEFNEPCLKTFSTFFSVRKMNFLEYYENKPVQVTFYNHSDYKHSVDDAIKKLLVVDFKYKESFYYSDLKLFFGYTAAVFALYGAWQSYQYPFHDPPVWYTTVFCIAIYTIFNSLMVGFMFLVEKNIIFRAFGVYSINIEALYSSFN